MIITRQQLAEHMDCYMREVADDPEYGGDRIDWVWDWLIAQGTTGPATGPTVRWLQLRKEGA